MTLALSHIDGLVQHCYGTRSKVLVSYKRFHHNASISQVSKPNTFGSKDIAQGKRFFKTKSKLMIKVTRSKVLVPKERSLHNASISQVSKL
jgi:hypothetical protein